MDTIAMKLRPNYHDEIDIMLKTEEENFFFDIPSGKEVVYNDNIYHFVLPASSVVPTIIHINDETYETEVCELKANEIVFKLKDCERPFLQSFGAIKIEMDIYGKTYYSKSIAVMVSNTIINNGVINMIDYIYNNCEKYLYEEHKYSSILSGIKDDDTISLEAMIAFLQETLLIYKKSYQYFKTNPYSKLIKTESVEPFDKLQSVSQKTIHFITCNINELATVNYDTGIRFNNQFYQPNRVLVERNSYSFDIYENQVIVGFLRTLVSEISKSINSLLNKTYLKNRTTLSDGYIDSMFQIYSRSIRRINKYVESLKSLKEEFKQLYYFYSELFNISSEMVISLPVFTPIFRSINAYRQIFIVIRNWFSIGNYDLGKDELLLSFISTSKIYEYYCLIKILRYIDLNNSIRLMESKRFSYIVNSKYFYNTKYNNTFVFENEKIKLTVYFQPVVFGDDRSVNGISLYRNTSTSSKSEIKMPGKIYTPDYIIKVEKNGKIDYLILDAKFSSPDNIRQHQLQELVYKYLFSISALEEKDRVLGLYIICGKRIGCDMQSVVHDLARNMNRVVFPFAEILTINGKDVNDNSMVSLIINNLI